MKKIVLAFLCFFYLSTNLFSQHSYPASSGNQPIMDDFFTVKETFLYEVKYGFLKLGWVEVELLSDTLYNGITSKHLVTEIRSNSRIPLVGKELDLFHSLFFINKDGIPVTSYYWKDNVDEDKYKELVDNKERRLSYSATKAALLILLYRDRPILHNPYKLLSKQYYLFQQI